MRSETGAHGTFGASLTVRGGTPARNAVLCFLAALLLAAALIVPSTILIAGRIATEPYLAQQSSAQTGEAANQHSVQPDDSSGKHGDPDPPPSPKRPKAVQHFRNGIGDAPAAVLSDRGFGVAVKDVNPPGRRVSATEAGPESEDPAPQLLQRPPPEG